MCIRDSAGGDRYLGVYNGSSWRHYSNPATDPNSNIKNQTVGFWKLEAADARESGIVTDLSTLQKGDKVVIFNTANLRTLSTEYSGFYNTANAVSYTHLHSFSSTAAPLSLGEKQSRCKSSYSLSR